MDSQMKRIISLLLSLVMLLSNVAAYGESNAPVITDWDSYVSSHIDEFTTHEAEKWGQQFEEMRNNTAAYYYRSGSEIDTTPRYIVLAIDNSGSMGGTPLAATKVASLRFCEQAFANTSNTYIAIITYDDYAATICDFSNDIQVLSNAIARLGTDGTTSHYRGLERADQLLSQVNVAGASKNIVIMSDGLPNDGPTSSTGPYTSQDYSSYRYANSAVNLAGDLHNRYTIYSLGFFHSLSGNSLLFGRRFMTDLANGGYWEVTDPDKLEFSFGDIVDTIITAKSGTFKYGGFINTEKDSTATYYYSDAYFNGDAREANPHLATMSLCLELSAWTSMDVPNPGDKATRKQKWVGAEKRTQNVRNLLTDIGYTNFKASPDWNNPPEMHSMGAVAAYKNVGDSTIVAVAVRGGGYFDEWGGNFVLGLSGNHTGFQNGRDEVYDFLKQYISENKKNFKSTAKLWIVGFSRGGAVANMVAGKLMTEGGLCSGVKFEDKNIFAYTFEAPQGYVGENEGYSSIHNYVYTYDLVPLVAPSRWGFQRYNKKDHFFTMGLGSQSHERLVAHFESQYNRVLQGVPSCEMKKNAQFKLNAYSVQFDVQMSAEPKVEWFGVVPYVDWNFDIDLFRSVPTQQMLTSSVDRLFGNILGGRTGYAALIEGPLSEILAFCLGFENKIDWIEVLNEALFAGNLSGAKKIVNELTNPFVSKDKQIENAAKAATEHICSIVEKRYNQMVDLGQFTIGLTSLLKALFDTIWENPWEFGSFMYYLISTGFQCHWPELSLAYMMCQDSYYMNETAFEKDFPESYRVIRINCPVDVTVYNEDGSVMSSICGDDVENTSRAHGSAITKEGTKQVVLPSDASYMIKVKATGDGEMNYTVLEYNMREGKFCYLQNYQNLLLKTGDEYWGSIPEYIPEDYYDEEADGSETVYQLKGPDGGVIPPSDILRGEDIRTAKVELFSNNDKGIVTGGGEYLISEFAKVKAICMPTVEFLGWYKNGVLVSREPEYRFEVEADVELVAKFSEGKYYDLSVTCTEGGTAGTGTFSIPSGMKVMMKAVPDEGYEFVGWEAGKGRFDNPNKADAVFTMPSADASVKAVFRPTDMNLPQTGDNHAALGTWLGLLLLSGIALLMHKRKKVC